MPTEATSQPETAHRLRVFLSHASVDKPAVRGLYERLHAEGFIEPWLDEEDLLPGQDWRREIPKAVRATDVVIVCLSGSSINKAGFFQEEIKYALDAADTKPEGAIFIIPVRLEECNVPERIARWQWVNLFKESGYPKLIRALQERAKELRLIGNQETTFDVTQQSGDPARIPPAPPSQQLQPTSSLVTTVAPQSSHIGPTNSVDKTSAAEENTQPPHEAHNQIQAPLVASKNSEPDTPHLSNQWLKHFSKQYMPCLFIVSMLAVIMLVSGILLSVQYLAHDITPLATTPKVVSGTTPILVTESKSATPMLNMTPSSTATAKLANVHVENTEPTEMFTGTLPITFTIRGSNLD